jgi:hypothetical protein
MIFIFLAGQELCQICGQASLLPGGSWRLLCILKVYKQEDRHTAASIGEVKLDSILLNGLLLKTVHEEGYLHLLRVKHY